MVDIYWGYLTAIISILTIIMQTTVNIMGNPLWAGLTVAVLVGIVILRLVF